MILAAGLGSRLRPLTDRMPKPLVQVGGRPLIAYPLALLRAAGIRDVVINLHHLGGALRAALGDGAAHGVSITYSEEAPTILDTGGGIKQAQAWLGGDRFVVLNSDTILDLDIADMIRFHAGHGALATMLLRPDREQRRYGEIEIDATARIRRFLGHPAVVDAPLTPLMFGGVHVFEPQVFDHMSAGRFGINTETYPRMLAAGAALYGYRFDAYWRVLDTHAGLAEGRWEAAHGDAWLSPRHRP
jgi:NDP-sugar pyrophosphorylase family protein